MKPTELFENDERYPGKRMTGHPDYEYEEKKKRKKDDNIDSVIAYIKGHSSAKFTKLGRRYARAKRIADLLTAEKMKLNEDTKKAVDEIFDAADDIYTRVVDTVSIVFKVAKAETRSSETFDKEAYLTKLEELTGLSVEALEQVRKEFTTIKTVQISPKLLAPKEKKPVNESEDDGNLEKIEQYAGRVGDAVDKFLQKWDSHFAALKQEIESAI